eukprot:2447562-Amphidinium_carterae.1
MNNTNSNQRRKNREKKYPKITNEKCFGPSVGYTEEDDYEFNNPPEDVQEDVGHNVRGPISHSSTIARGSKGDASMTEVSGVNIDRVHVTAEGECTKMVTDLTTATSSTSVGLMMR